MGVKSEAIHKPGQQQPLAVGIATANYVKNATSLSKLLGKIDAQMELRAGVAEPIVYGAQDILLLAFCNVIFFFRDITGSMSDSKNKMFSVF